MFNEEEGSTLIMTAGRLLDLADGISMRERGHPVRSWSQIRDGIVPTEDDLSLSDEETLRRAFALLITGHVSVPLSGKSPEEVLNALRVDMSHDAIQTAEDVRYPHQSVGWKGLAGRKEGS